MFIQPWAIFSSVSGVLLLHVEHITKQLNS